MNDTQKELSGIEKARATAEELKREQEEAEKEKEEKSVEAKEELTQLAVISHDKELEDLLNDSASVGAENLGGELPLLKIYSLGRSKDFLADGSKPNHGSLFYKPTGQQFESIDCHILTISRGYRAPAMEGGDKKDAYTQLMAGIMIEEGKLTKPFIMYMTGKKLNPMWDFGKEANKYTHAKPVAFPLYTLMVKLSTKEEANNFGTSYVPVFEIKRVEGGQPMITLDKEEIKYLRDSVATVEATMENVIQRKGGEGQVNDGNEPTPF